MYLFSLKDNVLKNPGAQDNVLKNPGTHQSGQGIQLSSTLEHPWGDLVSFSFPCFLPYMFMTESGL